MTTESAAGVLAVWNDRDDAIDAFYEQWYVGQHLPERVGLPGWHCGRRYEAVRAARRIVSWSIPWKLASFCIVTTSQMISLSLRFKR